MNLNLGISRTILYRVASSYLDNGVDVLSVAGIQSTLPRPNSLPLEYTSGRHIQILFYSDTGIHNVSLQF